jgi:hypothetical protein
MKERGKRKEREAGDLPNASLKRVYMLPLSVGAEYGPDINQ